MIAKMVSSIPDDGIEMPFIAARGTPSSCVCKVRKNSSLCFNQRYDKLLQENGGRLLTLMIATRSLSGQSPIAMIKIEMEVIPDFMVAKRSI